MHARAERRLESAQVHARSLREQVAAEVVRTQRDAQDELRARRQEATDHLAEARRDADEMRTQAKQLLAEAREEVAVLARRREAITNELGELSGVIQALAVPTDDRPDEPTDGQDD
jgi:hypothetical protein